MQNTSLKMLQTQILEFLRTELAIEDDLTIDTPLVTNGLVDSADLMRLAAFLERATGTTIPDRDISVAHFDTIRQIQSYFSRLVGA